jgi:hypothetical protein
MESSAIKAKKSAGSFSLPAEIPLNTIFFLYYGCYAAVSSRLPVISTKALHKAA